MRRALVVGLLALLGIASLPRSLTAAPPCTYTNFRLAKGALTTTLTTVLYTVPAATTVIVMSLNLASNATGVTVRAVTIKLAGAAIVPAFGLAANTAISFQLNHAMEAAETITGGQGVGTDVDYYISGVKITC